jgi:hypothetical protein
LGTLQRVPQTAFGPVLPAHLHAGLWPKLIFGMDVITIT